MMPLRIKLTRPNLSYACSAPEYFKPSSRLFGENLLIDCYLGTRSVSVVRAVDLTNIGADLMKMVFKLENRARSAGKAQFFGCDATKERYCAEGRCYYYLIQDSEF